MTDWIELLAALAAFFASHLWPVRPGMRDRLMARLGRRGFFTAYGTLSILVLAWVILAAGRAPHIELWPQAEAARWLPNLVMPLAMLLVVAGLGVDWPHTLGGRRGDPFDPRRPGLAAVTRHPLLLGLILWSGAHLGPNGDLAHVLLFGAFLGLSIAAIPMFDARARRDLSPDAAACAFRCSAILSLRPLADRQWLRHNRDRLLPRLIAALAVWALALALHRPVLSVSPLPH